MLNISFTTSTSTCMLHFICYSLDLALTNVISLPLFFYLDVPPDFWSSPSASDIQNGPVDPLASTSSSQAKTVVAEDRFTLLTRGRQGKLCFINPLFLQLEVSKVSKERLCGNVRFTMIWILFYLWPVLLHIVLYVTGLYHKIKRRE